LSFAGQKVEERKAWKKKVLKEKGNQGFEIIQVNGQWQ
jgi:hypothetical protein